MGHTGGRSASEQSRGYLCWPETVHWQRSRPVYLGTIVCPADARHSQGSGRVSQVRDRSSNTHLSAVSPLTPEPTVPIAEGRLLRPTAVLPPHPPSGLVPFLLALPCWLLRIIPVHTPSFHLPARCLGCAPGRGWPRRCHGKHASSLARPALRKQEAAAPVVMYLAVVSRSCDIQIWSHAGLRVVGVDGHLTAKECLGIKSITCRINRLPPEVWQSPATILWYGAECAVLFCRYPDPMLTRRRPLFVSYQVLRYTTSAEYGSFSHRNGLVWMRFTRTGALNTTTQMQKSAWAKCGIYQMWGSKVHGGISTPHMALMPRTLAWRTRAGDSEVLVRARPLRAVEANPRHIGCAALVPTARRKYLFVTPVDVRVLLSAQWRGSLWWAPMTPFSSRSPCLQVSMSRDKAQAREKTQSTGKGSCSGFSLIYDRCDLPSSPALFRPFASSHQPATHLHRPASRPRHPGKPVHLADHLSDSASALLPCVTRPYLSTTTQYPSLPLSQLSYRSSTATAPRSSLGSLQRASSTTRRQATKRKRGAVCTAKVCVSRLHCPAHGPNCCILGPNPIQPACVLPVCVRA